MGSAFIGSSVKTIFAKSSEYLTDMFSVKFFVVQIDKDVIEVDDYADIEHVGEDVIHESLESSWRVGKSERHD